MGRLDLFAPGVDTNMYHRYFDNALGWSSSFGGLWEPIGRPRAPAEFSDYPVAVAWGPNRLDICGSGNDGIVYHKFNDQGWGPGGIADPWESIGSPTGGVESFLGLSAVSWGPGRLDILARASDGRVYHKFFDGNSVGWGPGNITSDWESIGA